MTEILQTNLFFAITAAAVIVFTIFLCVAVFYVIKILRAVKNITERIDAGSETIADDMKQLRTYIAQGSLISQVVGLFINTKRRKKREEEEL